MPGMVTDVSSSASAATERARPKSSSLTPLAVRKMLVGFRSRWTMPRRCSAASADRIASWVVAASGTGMGPPDSRSASDWPSSSSMQRNGSPSCSPMSNSWQMLRMADRRRGARFANEALAHLRLRGAQDGLDRDRPRQPVVPAFVDDAHAAAANLADDAVGTDGVRHRGKSVGMCGQRIESIVVSLQICRCKIDARHRKSVRALTAQSDHARISDIRSSTGSRRP